MNKWFVLMVGFAVLSLGGCTHHHHRVKIGSVHFVLTDPVAKEVNFAYSLDGYEIHTAQKTGIWTWEVKVPGQSEFRYFYLVDGRFFLPKCGLREQDDFGTQNCIYSPGM